MAFGTVLQLLFWFILVLALAVLTARWLARLGVPSQSRLPLKLLAALPLGPRRQLAVVQVGERVLALGISEAGIETLTTWDDASALAVWTAQAATPPQGAGEFARLLRARLARGREHRGRDGEASE